ncbi:MAG: flagellar basal body L-ring protein FlgH [Acidobacteria bacterium]|nr:flagellar basal body L-ring protein FlgH [Acidobacteriota bacterium]
MKRMALLMAIVPLACLAGPRAAKEKQPKMTPLDRFIAEAAQGAGAQAAAPSAGSLWSPSARFNDLGSDVRAQRVHDIVTILVAERASAVSKGATSSARSSSAKSSMGALAGITRAAGPLSNLARLGGESKLDGQGATSRETVLDATLTARVTHVLPNGYLVVEGSKSLVVNSETQLITVRGIVRPTDLSTGNAVHSGQLGQLEVQVNGKGVVGDAIRRPFFLYRLLMGILPF